MKKAYISFLCIIILMFNLPLIQASESTILTISPSNHYDNQPHIWGNYVVWRRAINLNQNNYIEISEPSWIMIYDIKTKNSWNITPANVLMRDDVYQHAEAPDIWNGKVIYEMQVSSNSIDTRLYMYNISSRDTWQIPIKPVDYAHGHVHSIFGDWVTYTNKENDKRQAYLYNYNTREYRTLIDKNENKSVYGLVMSDKNVVLTVLDNQSQTQILNYNINDMSTRTISFGEDIDYMIATSVYDTKIGISYVKTRDNQTTYNSCVYDIVTGERTLIQGAYGVLLWGDNVAYTISGNIYLNIDNERSVINYTIHQHLGDIYGNVVVWVNDANSVTNANNTLDDFDIQIRLFTSDTELAWNELFTYLAIIVPVVLIVAYYYKKKEKDFALTPNKK